MDTVHFTGWCLLQRKIQTAHALFITLFLHLNGFTGQYQGDGDTAGVFGGSQNDRVNFISCQNWQRDCDGEI